MANHALVNTGAVTVGMTEEIVSIEIVRQLHEPAVFTLHQRERRF